MTRKVKSEYDSSHHDAVVKGMATILWGSAWADHVEEHGCCSLGGVEITSVMPPIPAEAWSLAERVLGRIEQANPRWGCNWPSMFAAAMRADTMPFVPAEFAPVPVEYSGVAAERFGECLAWMAMVAGVSWFDDHAQFELVVPLCAEDSELRVLADERCTEEEK